MFTNFIWICAIAMGMIFVIFRYFPFLFEALFLRISPSSWGRLKSEHRQRVYFRWFIAMRWLAVLISSLFVILAVKVLHLLPETVWWPLVMTVCSLAGMNFIYLVSLKWTKRFKLLLLAQVYIDLLILTALLHFSGGVENPLAMMMLFQVIVAGILLSRRQCFEIAGAASFFFGLLAWAEGTGFVDHYTFLLFPHGHDGEPGHFHAAHQPLYVISRVVLQTAVHFLTAYFVTTLSERIRLNERHLEQLTDQALADRQLLERSLETTSTALRVLDANLKPLLVNPQWDAWFSITDNHGVMDPGKIDGKESPAEKCLANGQVKVTELQLENPGLNPDCLRFFLLTTAPVLSAENEITQIVELAQEITEQKKVQDQMMRASQLAAVGELAGHVAHEVNNPIAIISAKTHLLMLDKTEEMSDKVCSEIQKIHDLSNRIAKIAQGLLSYGRPSASTRSVIDLRDPISKSFSMIEPMARSGGILIQDGLPDKLPPVLANAQEMEQVFLNLFLNAMDAMPTGGCISVGVDQSNNDITQGNEILSLAIEDSGTGISKEIQGNIFNPFFSSKKEGKGTGLGLSICVGLMRSHGGEIFLDTSTDLGSRFIVRLPIYQSDRT